MFYNKFHSGVKQKEIGPLLSWRRSQRTSLEFTRPKIKDLPNELPKTKVGLPIQTLDESERHLALIIVVERALKSITDASSVTEANYRFFLAGFLRGVLTSGIGKLLQLREFDFRHDTNGTVHILAVNAHEDEWLVGSVPLAKTHR